MTINMEQVETTDISEDTLQAHQAPLRVAHISATRGGVANAARRLHLGLLAIGVDSTLFNSKDPADERLPHNEVVPQAEGWQFVADRAARHVGQRFGLTGLTHVSSLNWQFPDYDVVHFHGVDDNWFNLRALRGLDKQHALVWTMHDKHLGTGACGYPEMLGDCQRWLTGCGNCPLAREKGWWLDLTAQVYRQRQAIMGDIQMGIAAPNRWMYDYIATDPITRNQTLRRIPYGMDTHTFQPYPMREARRALGLPLEGKLVLSVASRLNEPRKGVQYFPELLRQLRAAYTSDVAFVLVGSKLQGDLLAELNAIMPVYALGRIQDQAQLARAYSAADMFAITSIMDNFPNVVLESLACGTPVAGFAVGGIPDMIIPGETGVLAEVGDARAMAHGIAEVLSAEEATATALRETCRQRALEDFGLEVQAERYVEFYRDLIHQKQEVKS